MASASSTSVDAAAAKASGSASGFTLASSSSHHGQRHLQQQQQGHAQGSSGGSSSVGDEKAAESRSLRAWWSAFTKSGAKAGGSAAGSSKSSGKDAETRVFGVPLRKSLKYAFVAISMAGEDGQQYVWGYVPVIVAKVGLYLKEHATEVEGVFRIAGSQKRMRELQEIFDSPPKYGKSVEWAKYSVHDAASVLRRYLNAMPEPIVPLDLYHEFRAPMLHAQDGNVDVAAAIRTYRLLIASSPPANQYLLLYVLDLLAVFARKSETNLMPASNLAVIFQPGMFSHPSHLQSPNEHKIAVQVLEFLIEHQEHFVLGLSPPPPANVAPAELTEVSRPPKTNHDGTEVAREVPSDSDEDLGELEVHEGGGARLARSSTWARASASPSPGRKRGLFSGRRSAATPSPRPETENEDISGQANAPVAAVAAAAAAAKSGGSGVRRSKTTPTRRSTRRGSAAAEGVEAKPQTPDTTPAASSDAAAPAGASGKEERRRSSDGKAAQHANPALVSSAQTAPSALAVQPQAAGEAETGLPTPPQSKLLPDKTEQQQ